MRRICGAGDQRGYRGFASFVLAASIAAVLDFAPVFGPLLAPFKFKATVLADPGREPIFDLGYARHWAIVSQS